MRIQFNDIAKPKAAAKLLVKEAPKLTLSNAQEAIARSLDYRDLHELDKSVNSEFGYIPPTLDSAKAIALRMFDCTDVRPSDVIFVLTKSQIFRNFTLEESQEILCSLWRNRVFEPRGKGTPGTVVRVKEQGNKRPAYLVSYEKGTFRIPDRKARFGFSYPRSMSPLTRVLYDTDFGGCVEYEVVTPKVPLADFVPSRLWLPYGYWTLKDGSVVTFSRDYKPMWRTSQNVCLRQDPWLRVEDIEGQPTHFSTLAGTAAWSHGTARELAIAHLRELRIKCLPKLVDAMAFIISTGAESVGDAVNQMKSAATPQPMSQQIIAL
jgi:hypothetical protein